MTETQKNKKTHKKKFLDIKKIRKQAGLTLLEIMVVLVIIGVLVALVAPRISTYIRDAKITATKTELSTIKGALNSYYNTRNQYPFNLQIIAKDYLEKAKVSEGKLLDPWGVPYSYKTENSGGLKNQRFVLSSAGADNIHGNKDDITEEGGSKLSKEAVGDEFNENLENELLEEDFD